MPDQSFFDDFDTGRIPVDPLPAAEVRRRGDRLRRRHNALAAVGGVAVVALIATPIAVLSGNDGRDPLPAPAPTVTTGPTEPPPTTAIPEDFPIDPGSSVPEVPPPDFLAQQLGYCGVEPLADLDPVDATSAQTAGGEMSTAVTLLLFEDGSGAARAVDNLVDSAMGCPREVTNVVGEVEVLPESGDDWPGQTIRTAYSADAAFVSAVRAGPALLLSSWYVAGTPAEQGLAESRAAVADQVAALDEIWDVPDWGLSAAGTAGNADEVPPDFPIAWDAAGLTGDGGMVRDPGPRRLAVEVSPCDRAVWPVASVDRLLFTSTGPGVSESRELAVLSSTEEAKAAITGILAALESCPTEVNDQDPTSSGEQAWQVRRAVTGREDVLTFSRFYTDGQLGGTIWQLTRVGNAVLSVSTDGEYSRDSLPSVLDRLTDVTGHLQPDMCVFSDDGC